MREKIQVKRASNGFVIEHTHDADESGYQHDETTVFEFDYDGSDALPGKHESEAFRDFVYELAEKLGVCSGRYDLKRFYGIIAPGDKNDAFEEFHSDAIWGKDTDSDS